MDSNEARTDTTHQPILILKEGTSRGRPRDVLGTNASAVRIVAEVIKTSYGPQGLDKMLVGPVDNLPFTITKDAATILKDLGTVHPAARLAVEAITEENIPGGDAAGAIVILGAELLAEAEKLVDSNYSVQSIVDVYGKTTQQALQILGKISTRVGLEDVQAFKAVARAYLTSKMFSPDERELADLVVAALLSLSRRNSKGTYATLAQNIKIIKRLGAPLSASQFIRGYLIESPIVQRGMPRKVENARILIADVSIGELPENSLGDFVQNLLKIGARVVITTGEVDEALQRLLATSGVMAVAGIPKRDAEGLARIAGGRVVRDLRYLSRADLVDSKFVKEVIIEDSRWTLIEGRGNAKAATLVIGGPSPRELDRVEQSLRNAILATSELMLRPKVVLGGGAAELQLAHRLRRWSAKLTENDRFVVKAFTVALESIPWTLANNSSQDPVQVLDRLRYMHEHGRSHYGISPLEGRVSDMMKERVFEPLTVKERVLTAATRLASRLIPIDDIIAAPSGEIPVSEIPNLTIRKIVSYDEDIAQDKTMTRGTATDDEFLRSFPE